MLPVSAMPVEVVSCQSQSGSKTLPPLPNADKYTTIVTRFAPNPDFVLHLGSIRAIILYHDYALMYKGRFLLRFDDTDPRLKKSALEYYDLIMEDVRWLECEWDAEYIASDRIPLYYEHAEKVLRSGDAYICTCTPDDFRVNINAGRACPDRSKSAERNLADWEKMLNGGLGEGEAVLRVKTDLAHPNPAVRDWPALRIIDPVKYPHPRDRKSTRLNSSHLGISYAVFCLKKKNLKAVDTPVFP